MSAFSPAFLARVRDAAMHGSFEAHLTADVGAGELARFEAACGALGVAFVAIELAAGIHRAQPMTSSQHRGVLADAIAATDALHARLVGDGFAIARVKLETDVASTGIPRTAEDAARLGGYFEFHVKLRDPDVARLTVTCERVGARVSRNARRAGERFATLRAYACGRDAAEQRLAVLLDALAAAGHDVIATSREYSLYDSRIELDAGWLDHGA
jgi:hypothetical protein